VGPTIQQSIKLFNIKSVQYKLDRPPLQIFPLTCRYLLDDLRCIYNCVSMSMGRIINFALVYISHLTTPNLDSTTAHYNTNGNRCRSSMTLGHSVQWSSKCPSESSSKKKVTGQSIWVFWQVTYNIINCMSVVTSR